MRGCLAIFSFQRSSFQFRKEKKGNLQNRVGREKYLFKSWSQVLRYKTGFPFWAPPASSKFFEALGSSSTFLPMDGSQWPSIRVVPLSGTWDKAHAEKPIKSDSSLFVVDFLKIKPIPYLHMVQFYQTDCWANLDETLFRVTWFLWMKRAFTDFCWKFSPFPSLSSFFSSFSFHLRRAANQIPNLSARCIFSTSRRTAWVALSIERRRHDQLD